jgi:surfactin synthase thioesterase subunit
MSSWFRCFQPTHFAEVRLVCFPHAGGSATFYRDWHKQLSSAVEVHAVQYPGRADRMRDPMIDDALQLAQSVTKAMKPLSDRPVALFGHSMGALIAYEVALMLTTMSMPPIHLFVSGASAPHDRTPRCIADADDQTFLSELRRIGGTDSESLADPELRELFMPYIRNDFRLVESYTYRNDPPLTIPITAITGEDDRDVSPDTVESWRVLTTGEFSMRVLPGDHFYLVPAQSDVLGEIRRHLGIPSAIS